MTATRRFAGRCTRVLPVAARCLARLALVGTALAGTVAGAADAPPPPPA